MENGSEVRAVEVRVFEVRYAGVLVGRSTKVRDWDGGGAFIGFAEPLPSGTSLVLRGEGLEQRARVVEVFESADPAVAGMQVKFVGAAAAARPASKPAAAASSVTATAPAPVAPAAPVAATPEASPAVEATAAAASATVEQGDGEAGQADQGGPAGSGGKRRRRRR